MLEIVVDHRESRSPVFVALKANPELSIVVRELPCGDYLPHPAMAVERKEATDFVLSIMDRRLFAQVLRLKEDYAQVCFLIEGNPYATRSVIKPEAIRAALSYLIAIEGVSVLMVKDAVESHQLIAQLARHMQEGLGYTPPLRGDKPKDAKSMARYLIEGLPGVGPATAVLLAQHFGSPMAVFSASTEARCTVPGIGKLTATRIRAALDMKIN